ncbi:hypothetical protein CPB84DRAFT_1690171, partial [Gymnopilus junonius]
LGSGSVHPGRWMRDIKHWRADQKAGHAVFTVVDRKTANLIMKNGLVVQGKRLLARKLEEDPRRCYKCQFLNPGHTADQCPSIAEVCPNCAGCGHPAGACKATAADYKCITCRKMGCPYQHAAWDRKRCTMFMEAKKELRRKHPENNYRFFLSE